MHVNRHRVVAWLFLLALPCVVWAGPAMKTFRLESVRNARVYGPFEYREGARVYVEKSAYRLGVGADGAVTFTSLNSGAVDGPYDFELGRIAILEGQAFTVVAIDRVELPAGTQRPEHQPPPVVAPAPRPVRVAPVRPTAVPPVRTRPAPSPRPARRVSPPVRPVPDPFMEGAELGAELWLLHDAEYELNISGVPGSRVVTVERGQFAVFFRKRWLSLRAGMLFDASWEDDFAGEVFTFDRAQVPDGNGWWLAVAAQQDVWRYGAWHADVFGEVSFRQEEYTLQYRAWAQTEVPVPGPDTNGVLQATAPVWDFEQRKTDVDLVEYVARAGVFLRYTEGPWSAYGGILARLLTETDVDGTIETGEGAFDIELERQDPVTIALGGGVELGGVNCLAELRVGGTLGVRLGASWRF